MRNRCPDRPSPATPTRRFGLCVLYALCATGGLLLVGVVMAACAGVPTEAPTDEPPTDEPTPADTDTPEAPPTEVPTATLAPTPDYTDMLSLPSLAADTPEETFERYLLESLTQQASLQREKLDMRIRYQNPTTLLQDLGGLILDIELVENRSRRTVLREASATFEVEIDIRITYADGDTSTQTCAWTTTLQRSSETWYVVNPSPLALTNCA